ncbi:MAG: hypothetical protein ACE5RP_00205 [Nitrosopumilus sp.]
MDRKKIMNHFGISIGILVTALIVSILSFLRGGDYTGLLIASVLFTFVPALIISLVFGYISLKYKWKLGVLSKVFIAIAIVILSAMLISIIL